MSKLHEIFCACYCGRGSTLLLWRYDWSCTSGFVDDTVMFATNWLGKGDASIGQKLEETHAVAAHILYTGL